jgi:transcriptional regulator with XRE-family HTH domain
MWSQEEVARRMEAFGYEWHQTLIGRIEAAQRPLRLNEAVDLAALFGVTLDQLMWANRALAAEEIDAQIEDAQARMAVARDEWLRLREREARIQSELATISEETHAAEARVSTVAGELARLGKLRGERVEPG